MGAFDCLPGYLANVCLANLLLFFLASSPTVFFPVFFPVFFLYYPTLVNPPGLSSSLQKGPQLPKGVYHRVSEAD